MRQGAWESLVMFVGPSQFPPEKVVIRREKPPWGCFRVPTTRRPRQRLESWLRGNSIVFCVFTGQWLCKPPAFSSCNSMVLYFLIVLPCWFFSTRISTHAELRWIRCRKDTKLGTLPSVRERAVLKVSPGGGWATTFSTRIFLWSSERV